MYENELKALKKAGRFRERKIYDVRLDDLASNDYLGLSRNKKQFKKAVKLVNEYTTVSSKASMLVNGYHPIHRIFEMTMAEYNGFEEGLIVGSGFLANMALIEALVRKGDMLFMDEEYHASGVMANECQYMSYLLCRYTQIQYHSHDRFFYGRLTYCSYQITLCHQSFLYKKCLFIIWHLHRYN